MEFDWIFSIAPLVIACASVVLTLWGMKKKATKDRVAAMEERVDRTCRELSKCEEAVKSLKAENKSLRKDKMDLLEKIAEIVSGDKE